MLNSGGQKAYLYCGSKSFAIITFSVQHKSERMGDIDDSLIGGNASAEAAPEDGGAEATCVHGINVVLAHKLIEVKFAKKEFKKYLKVVIVILCFVSVIVLQNLGGMIKKKLKGSPREDIFLDNAVEASKVFDI